jgi:hypothetical protein
MGNGTSNNKRAEAIFLGLFIATALAVGYIQSVVWMPRVGWDTVSYLELADAIRSRNFSLALSPYWSPLYPCVVAAAETFAPSLVAERSLLCTLQFIFFLLYGGASFLFWRAVLKAQSHFAREDGRQPWPRQRLIGMMAGVSVLSGLAVGDVTVKGPDMLSAAIYLSANALLVSALYRKTGVAETAVIGFLMGLAYLAKAFFVSWLFPCLLLLAVFRKHFGFNAKHLATLTITMLATMALYAVPLSIKVGHPTFGESGKYQIVFSSNDRILPMVPMVHGSRLTKHPSNILVENPTIYEFAQPFDVSYPPWFDPHYWNDGLSANVDWEAYTDLLVDKSVTLFFSFLIFISILKLCCMFSARKLIPYSLDRLKVTSPIWLTATFCSALYLFLSAAVARYFMGFIPVMFSSIVLAYKSPGDELAKGRERRTLLLLTILMISVFLAKSLLYTYFFFPQIGDSLSKTTDVKLPETRPTDPHTATANKLAELGIKPKDRIMRIAKNEGGEYYWARLADVRIVAECVTPDDFFKASPEKLKEIYEKLKAIGVKAIVLDYSNRRPQDEPPVPPEPEWQRVPDTKNSIRLLSP